MTNTFISIDSIILPARHARTFECIPMINVYELSLPDGFSGIPFDRTRQMDNVFLCSWSAKKDGAPLDLSGKLAAWNSCCGKDDPSQDEQWCTLSNGNVSLNFHYYKKRHLLVPKSVNIRSEKK